MSRKRVDPDPEAQPRNLKGKQGELPGVTPSKIPAVQKAALDYLDARRSFQAKLDSPCFFIVASSTGMLGCPARRSRFCEETMELLSEGQRIVTLIVAVISGPDHPAALAKRTGFPLKWTRRILATLAKDGVLKRERCFSGGRTVTRYGPPAPQGALR